MPRPTSTIDHNYCRCDKEILADLARHHRVSTQHFPENGPIGGVEAPPQGRPVTVFRVEPIIILQPVAIAGSQVGWFIESRRFLDRGRNCKDGMQRRQRIARTLTNALSQRLLSRDGQYPADSSRTTHGPSEGQLHSLRRAEAVLVIACPLPLMRDVRVVNRVVVETEYGALVHDAELSTEAWPARVKNYIFRQARAGALDLHYRDYEEPPGNGGFLLNGGRLYLDMGHIDYASPECGRLRDAVVYDLAGDALLLNALRKCRHAITFPSSITHRSLHWRDLRLS